MHDTLAQQDVPPTVGVIDPDPVARNGLRSLLHGLGIDVSTFDSAESYLLAVNGRHLSCLIVDLLLPGMSGLELLRRLRHVTDAPIIVLSPRDDEEAKVALLDAGADDFLTKPCADGELLARVRGQLRRAATSAAARTWAHVAIDGVEIDLVAQRVVRHGEPQRLTPTEWAILRALVLYAGRPLSPRQLWDIVWAREFGDFATHVRVHLTHLRRKIEPNPAAPQLIVTVPGVGYRFVAPTGDGVGGA